ncbi:MAG TPA: hypothetical protein VNK03_04740 [Gammaproteobacteria bacterium]|nr:hypothetical protein [Gammaproteobacteria bacterium]
MSDAPKFKTFRDLRNVPSIAVKETSPSASIPSTASNTSIARESSNTSIAEKKQTDISPTRNFQKVPNSVSKNLDLFRGKSKQVWDYLWSVSRGAINPTRIVRKSRNEIKKGSALGSMVTVDAAIKHLEQIGLIKKSLHNGSLIGNEYEIFTPEEIVVPHTSYTSIASNTSLAQKVDILDIPESSISSTAQPVENKRTLGNANTLLNTNKNNDDEPFGRMNETLAKALEKVSGKRPQKSDAAKLNELAELLAMELEIAAARTKSVSNVPAFLTEHLRRRLLGTSTVAKPPESKSKVSKSLRVGQANDFEDKDVEVYQAEPLSKQGREAVLKTMQEYLDKGQGEFILSFQNTYTTEDWTWLSKELEKEK